ncbi:MAG: glycosyltransferase family 2 protein [Rhodocyclaceae bacterium]
MPPATEPALLAVTIVLYRPHAGHLGSTLMSLRQAAARLQGRVQLVLVDNGGGDAVVSRAELERDFPHFTWIGGQGNVGFGAGHNLGLRNVEAPYVLVLNPDVLLDEDSLVRALAFMERNPRCALLSPAVLEVDGSRQYLCKRFPSVFDLFLRGIAPEWLRQFFARRMARYEMRDLVGDTILWDPPIVSGCFMLFRKEAFDRVEGFDESFFLYFEDFDISLRTAKIDRLAYVPDVRIIHHGGDAASKGWRHIRLFVRSALRFFRVHGWKWV